MMKSVLFLLLTGCSLLDVAWSLSDPQSMTSSINGLGQQQQQQQQQDGYPPPPSSSLSSIVRPADPPSDLQLPASSVLSPAHFSEVLAREGAVRCREATPSLLRKSVLAGMYVGIGGMLCSTVGGSLVPAFWEQSAGLNRFAFGAVGFPLSIILVTITGMSAFTGNLAFAGAAVTRGKVRLSDTVRMLSLTYFGCLIGCVLTGALAVAAGIPGVLPCGSVSSHKLALDTTKILARGIGGGTLIGLAIVLATAAIKGGSGFISVAAAIWFPISTYVILDFEHCLANMFFFAVAALSKQDISKASIAKNLLFSTAGNMIGAGVVVGGALIGAIGS